LTGGEFHSLQEAQDAINGLRTADWHRLDRIARFQVFCYPQLSGDDLLQEAFDRVLCGRRNWRRGVPFPVFMYGVLQSIADEWRDDQDLRYEVPTADLRPDDSGESPDIAEMAVSRNTNPERALQVARLLNTVQDEFVQSDADLSFLLGTMEGRTAKETQAEYGLTPQEYGAARKRWERWLATHYPEGLKL
jgi:DNA-directed RNA polymerase specialized sigma24 family protein